MCWRSGYVGLCLRLVGNVCASACGLRECECTQVVCEYAYSLFACILMWGGMYFLFTGSPSPPCLVAFPAASCLFARDEGYFVIFSMMQRVCTCDRCGVPLGILSEHVSCITYLQGWRGRGEGGDYILLACLTFPSAWRTLELWKWKKMRLIYFPVDRLGYFPFFFISFFSVLV